MGSAEGGLLVGPSTGADEAIAGPVTGDCDGEPDAVGEGVKAGLGLVIGETRGLC